MMKVTVKYERVLRKRDEGGRCVGRSQWYVCRKESQAPGRDPVLLVLGSVTLML